jgi:O-methyltransferase involved in polyketide biosynthesis
VKEKDASFTVMMTAYMRAYHAMHDTPKIFDDFVSSSNCMVNFSAMKLTKKFIAPL